MSAIGGTAPGSLPKPNIANSDGGPHERPRSRPTGAVTDETRKRIPHSSHVDYRSEVEYRDDVAIKVGCRDRERFRGRDDI